MVATGFVYVASVLTGVATGRLLPPELHSFLARSDLDQAAQVENIFGRFREPVRAGQPGAIIACSALVLALNLFGSLLTTLGGMLVVPIALNLGVGGWWQGVSLSELHPSSFLSGLLFLLMGGLEWITYPLATAAGLNVVLSVLFPQRQAVASRWLAFRRAWGDTGRIYVVIAGILAVQAVCEVLYVRKGLLMGGTGVPLLPY